MVVVFACVVVLAFALWSAERAYYWRQVAEEKAFAFRLADARADHWRDRFREAERALVQVHMSGTAGQQRPIHWTTMN